MSIQRYIGRLGFGLLVLVAAFLSACDGEPAYPSLLVDADSAFMQGHYRRGDSLLARYEQQPADSRSDAVAMYHQLLKLEKTFLFGEISDTHFSMADSLSRFYSDFGSLDKYGKALLILGGVYQEGADYPSALECYLKAGQVAKELLDAEMEGLSCRCLGDLYFIQRMLDECVPYYRRYYDLALANRDTLRVAYAASAMGRVFTINDDVDSTIYYYKQAIDLAEGSFMENDILPKVSTRLCDIYIQIEEYDSALAIMPRNPMNAVNWGYWHYGQNHLDSAIYYFEQAQETSNWRAKAEYLQNLADLETMKGNTSKAMSYYAALVAARDSQAVSSQVEETRKAEAKYRYNSIKQERDKMEEYGRTATLLLIFLLVSGLLFATIAYFCWLSYSQRKNAELEREKRLKLAEENRHKQSLEQLKQNTERLKLLELQLVEAQKRGDEAEALRIKLDGEALAAENKKIEAVQRRSQQLIMELRRMPVYLKIKENAGNGKCVLTEEEWSELAVAIDRTYNNFTSRLLDLADLKGIELSVCHLMKVGLSPVEISMFVMRTKSTISMMSARIYKKLTQKKGAAKELQSFIQAF